MTRLLLSTVLLLSLLNATLRAETLIFSPSDLVDFEQSGTSIYQKGRGTPPANLTASIVEDKYGIQESNTLRFRTETNGPSDVTYIHEIANAMVHLTEGEITRIDFSIELNDPAVGGSSDTPILFGLIQDQQTYFYAERNGQAFPFRSSGSMSFVPFKKENLSASSFALFDSSDKEGVNRAFNPNFSSEGSPIQFIYGTISSTGQISSIRHTEFRNSQIVVYTDSEGASENISRTPPPAPQEFITETAQETQEQPKSNDPYSAYVASDTVLYTNLTPHFEMPDLQVPQFPDQDFNIVDFGARSDDGYNNADAIHAAITACFKAGGGRVVIPPGEWTTGAIHLKSFVNLHVSEGAVLKFSQNFEDYLPVVFTRWEGMECMNYSPPIYGNGLTNIAITGTGTIDGQGEFWWDWKEKQGAAAHRLYKMVRQGVPPAERILGTEKDAMRPNFIQFINCTNILVENVTLRDGPMWTLHPVYCVNMIVRGIKVITQGPNNDGIDPDSTKNLLIEDSYFSTGDDCVVIKAGLNEDGWRVSRPSENIVIRRIHTHKGHGGVVIGSEMSGSVRNVHAYDCTFDGTLMGIRVKTMPGRGGAIENVWVDNIEMRNIGGSAIRLNSFYQWSTLKPATDTPVTVRNFHISNISGINVNRGINITGHPDWPIEDISFENLTLKAAQSITITDAKGIQIRNIEVECISDQPIQLADVYESTFENLEILGGKAEKFQISGDKSRNIEIINLNGLEDISPFVTGDPWTYSYFKN